MRHTEIAPFKPYEGAPQINSSDILGASPEKPIIFRIPVTGKRPIKIYAKNLPKGLSCSEKGIIEGKIGEKGIYDITLCAENSYGTDEKKLTLEIKENNILLTPLLGFTSWNAYGDQVTQEDMIHTVDLMEKKGIFEYGYSYINLDSSWQGKYGGKFDAVLPNEKFPDMKAMCDYIHQKGLKAGIYSTPMMQAWGCPPDMDFLPGCTVGDADIRFPTTGTGIGTIRKEANNVKQWEEWGFDYLKYDWSCTDSYNAELMRAELIKASRDFGFCVTVAANPWYIDYWKNYVNSYRNNPDSDGTWDRLLEIYSTYAIFNPHINKGHYYDLDMLELGYGKTIGGYCSLTDDEKVFAYTLRAFLTSPIQISSVIEKLSDYELSIICNSEIIAINQDKGCKAAFPIYIKETNDTFVHVYKKELSDGGFAICILNFGDKPCDVCLPLIYTYNIRDVWAQKNIFPSNYLSTKTMPHCTKVFRMYKTSDKS